MMAITTSSSTSVKAVDGLEGRELAWEWVVGWGTGAWVTFYLLVQYYGAE